jgi:hypothetical protein
MTLSTYTSLTTTSTKALSQIYDSTSPPTKLCGGYSFASKKSNLPLVRIELTPFQFSQKGGCP